MRLAIISDVHGNLEALGAVWADMQELGVDKVYCLGDSVGYGPDPQAVVDELAARGVAGVMGNHELGLTDDASLEWFNSQARAALETTRGLLKPATLASFADLPRHLSVHGLRLVHGLPPDSPLTYLFEASDTELVRVMSGLEEEISLVGHTHELGLVRLKARRVEHQPLQEGRTELTRDARWLINVGAVGQPRDGDPRAKYVVVEPGEGWVELRRVAYDAEPTKAKILARGLSPIYADRLG